MNKVILWLVALSLVVGAIAITEAQQPAKVPRVGVFLPASAPATAHLVEAFRQGLPERGYIGTQNVTLELRYAEGKVERLASIATELVRLKVDVMVVGSTPGVMAAKNATSAIPIINGDNG
jgi:putative ABC transport system substrate-binding protein